MKIIYLGIGYPQKGDKNIYTDLMSTFLAHGHQVTVVCGNGAEGNAPSSRETEQGIDVLRVRTGSVIGNVSIIRKGLSTFLADYYFKKAVKQHLDRECYDLILCSTPPITLVETIKYLKRKNKARVYLMLKDIFPQNAVDMGMMRKSFVLYPYFRGVEKTLYRVSDYIGCMSEANMRYVLAHNSYVSKEKVGLCVNSSIDTPLQPIDKEKIRQDYGLPRNATVFIYGGNLGQPQGIGFLVDFLKTQLERKDRFFLICGKGKEAWKLQQFIAEYQPTNVKHIPWLAYEEYEKVTRACDVGMIFLDHRFSIPNFPSRLLSVMHNELPVLAATDRSTDVNEKIAEGDFGWWCESTDAQQLCALVDSICADAQRISIKGANAKAYYRSHYTCETTYRQIMEGLATLEGHCQ